MSVLGQQRRDESNDPLPPHNRYPAMNSTVRFCARLLPTLLLAGSLTVVSSPSYAAPPAGDEISVARVDPGIIDHLRNEIRDRDPDRQENALVDVIALAACQGSCDVQLQSRPGESARIDGASMDLDRLGPALLHAYRYGATDQHRLLAIAALINVGNEKSIDALIETPTPVSEKVARTTQRHITSFYLDRYPELRRRVQRTGTVSLDDVAWARARHERALRKQAQKG